MQPVRLELVTPLSRAKHSTSELLRSLLSLKIVIVSANHLDPNKIPHYAAFHLCLNCLQRTSDGGNGNHSVSLPIISIKIKVDLMLPYSYISSLLVSIL